MPRFILHTHGHLTISERTMNLAFLYTRTGWMPSSCRALRRISRIPLVHLFQVNAEIHILEDKETVSLDELSLEVIHTPGHTPGGICLKSGNVIFTGDTLFAGGIGRTDFPGASEERLIQSIEERLMGFPDETVNLSAIIGPSSTIGRERKRNPLCRN